MKLTQGKGLSQNLITAGLILLLIGVALPVGLGVELPALSVASPQLEYVNITVPATANAGSQYTFSFGLKNPTSSPIQVGWVHTFAYIENTEAPLQIELFDADTQSFTIQPGETKVLQWSFAVTDSATIMQASGALSSTSQITLGFQTIEMPTYANGYKFYTVMINGISDPVEIIDSPIADPTPPPTPTPAPTATPTPEPIPTLPPDDNPDETPAGVATPWNWVTVAGIFILAVGLVTRRLHKKEN